MILSKRDLKEALPEGKWHWESRTERFVSVSTDTRKPLKGTVFFALKGQHFDGHDFLTQASDNGAALLIASDKKKIASFIKAGKPNCGLIQVEDTLKALQSTAVFWRKKLGLKLICLTGSSGKTTTKQFTSDLLPKAFASPGSFNNHFGVPLSILSVKRKKGVLVQEIGASHKGEIRALTHLCEPLIAAVTAIGPAHLAGFNNMKSLAKEKQQIYEKSPNAKWIFNEDNPWTRRMLSCMKGTKPPEEIFTFSGINKKARVCFFIVQEKRMSMRIKGLIEGVSGSANLHFSGCWQLENLMCAASLALAGGARPETIWQRLSLCRMPPGRQNWFELRKRKVGILFDAYNANPLSMQAFLQQCHKYKKGRLILILGDMKELGAKSASYHKSLGQSEYLRNADVLWYIGQHADLIKQTLKTNSFKGEFIQSESYEKNSLKKINKQLRPGDTVGIKASRSLKLEQALSDLTGRHIF